MSDDASTAATVRTYFATVANLDSTEAELRELLDPAATFRELPNTIAPNGHVRDVEQTIAGFLAGKSRLSEQEIVIDELLVSGDRAAVRSTWRGTTATTAIVAHMAGFVTVRDGRILAHDTYDCYEPFTL